MSVTTDLHIEVDWNRDGDWGDSNEDISDLVLSIQTAIGGSASSLTGKKDAGRDVVVLNNDDDRFSNYNAASPLMSVPTFVTAGTSSTANGSAPTPGLPAGMAVGDCMICVFYSREATDATVSLPSPAWKEVYNNRDSSGLLAVWRRIYQTGDSAPTFTVSGLAAGDDCIAQLAAWRKVNTARPITVKGTISSNTSAQDIGAISGITLPANAMLIVIGGKADDWTSVATLSQSGVTFTEIAEPDTTTGNDAGLVWDYGTVDAGTALAITSKTFAVTGGGSAVGKGVMFALNPEPQVRQGALMRVRDNTDILSIRRVSKITPTVTSQGEKRAILEAVGIFDEMARLQVTPIASEGGTTGAIIEAALDDAGIDSDGIDAGDVTLGAYGSSTTSKVSLLSEVQKVAEHELGQLYEDQENYRPVFKARSHRPGNTTSLATFSDDPNETLHYEGIEQLDSANAMFNRCISGVTPYTVGTEAVLLTIPGPHSMSPGGTVNLVAQYADAPLISWNGHTHDVYYGSNVPVHQSDTESGDTSATPSFTLPATITADDLLLAFVHAGTTITAGPTGWAEIASVDLSASSGKYFKVYAFKAVGTEDGGTISVTLSVSAAAVCQVQRYTSWNGKISEIEVSTVSTGTGTAPNPPSITPSWGALKAMFVTAAIASAGVTNFTEPSGYSTANPLLLTSGSSYYFATAYRAESTGVSSEDAGAWTLDASRNYATFTIAIRGARSVSSSVSAATPNTLDGAFSIAYDSGLGGGVGQQDIENIQVSGVALTESDQAFTQADYLPTQDILTGVGIRTYPSPATLFASDSDSQEYADIVVDRYGEAHPLLRMRYTANKNSSLYAQAVALQVNDRITLEANNNAGLGVAEDFFIEGIYRSITPGQLHQVVYELSPASVTDE